MRANSGVTPGFLAGNQLNAGVYVSGVSSTPENSGIQWISLEMQLRWEFTTGELVLGTVNAVTKIQLVTYIQKTFDYIFFTYSRVLRHS